MKLVKEGISMAELIEMSQKMGGLVKAVVDVKRRIMVIDADLHADQEKFLLEQGSSQDDIWGINLYPNLQGDEFIEFDSMINVRPRLKNMSRVVENKQLQGVIRVIIAKLVHTK